VPGYSRGVRSSRVRHERTGSALATSPFRLSIKGSVVERDGRGVVFCHPWTRYSVHTRLLCCSDCRYSSVLSIVWGSEASPDSRLMISYRYPGKPPSTGGSMTSSCKLGWLLELYCDRKAGERIGGMRATEVIGECGYTLVSILLTTRKSDCRLVESKRSFHLR
jgi:hypothetical protein